MGGKPEKLPIPDNEKEKANELHNALVEKAAENDEKLMEKYFEKGTLDEDEMREGMKLGMIHHDVFPVFVMSAKKNMGSGRMMGFIDNVAPSPLGSKTRKNNRRKRTCFRHVEAGNTVCFQITYRTKSRANSHSSK